jgi:hypothetical protein
MTKESWAVAFARRINDGTAWTEGFTEEEVEVSETDPKEQKFTVVVYDEAGKVALFRQVPGYSAFGVISQIEGMRSTGNRDYGLDTTDLSKQPDYDISWATEQSAEAFQERFNRSGGNPQKP